MKRKVIFYLIVLVLAPLAGIGSRLSGDLPVFIQSHAGDFFWAVAAYVLVSLFFHKKKIFSRSIIAFLFAVLVEILQLADWPVLEVIRSFPAGKLLIGTGFLWMDFIRYAAGIVFISLIEGLLFYKKRSLQKSFPY